MMEEWVREMYLLHAKSSRFRIKIEQARQVVKQAIKEHPGIWAISCSGGKDSVAMLYICLLAGWYGPIFHFYYDETPTTNTELVQGLAKEHGLELHLAKVPGAFDVFQEIGHFFVYPSTDDEKRAVSKMLMGYKRTVNRYVNTQGWAGQFLGLRKSESRARGIMLKKKGYIYQTNDRNTWTACPLADWKAEDVWACIISRGLPYLDVYDRTDDPERERSEITWLAAESLWRHGMAARLKRENPEQFNLLVSKYPEIRYYV